jgi:hypothetical protein
LSPRVRIEEPSAEELRIILDTLESLKMAYPKVDAKRRRALLAIRRQLERDQ